MIRVNETVVTKDSMTVGEFKKALEDIYHDYFPNSEIYLRVVGNNIREAELRVHLFLGTAEEQRFLGCDIFGITAFIQGLPRLVLSWGDTLTIDKPLRIVIPKDNYILTTDSRGTDERLPEINFIRSDVSNLYEDLSVQECLDIFETYVHDINKQTKKLVRRGYLNTLAKTGYKEPLDLDSKLN